MRTIFLALLIPAFVSFGSQISFAGLIASDDFESYSSASAIAGGSGGSGWAANWLPNAASVANVEEHTIAYPTLIDGVSYTGGTKAVKCTGPATACINNFVDREFASQSDTVYFSVLAERHYDESYKPHNSTNQIFMQFQLSDNQPANNAEYGGVVFWKEKLEVRNSGTLTSEPYTADTAFCVVKLSKSGALESNYNSVELFINPTSRTEPGTPDASVTRDMGTSAVSYFALRSAYFTNTNYAYFDDVRIGTDFASVLPVPEPSTVALLMVGGIALCLVRRRSR